MENFMIDVNEIPIGITINCKPDPVIKFKKDPIFFRVNQSKLDNQVKLSNQLNLFCKRYFSDMDGNLDIIMGYNGTDFVDNKITILIRPKNNIDKL